MQFLILYLVEDQRPIIRLNWFPGEDDDHGPDDVDGGEDGEEGEPDPEEDVDLLVDDVDGEDALRVVPLDGARGAVLAERALGHAREHPRHRVDPRSGLGVIKRLL